MGLGGILQELKTEGVLALYHDYRSGRLVDYSGNGNNGIVGASAYFNKQGHRHSSLGFVTVPMSASLAWNNAVTVVYLYYNIGLLFDGIYAQYALLTNAAPFQGFRLFNAVGWSDGVNLRTGGANPALYNCAAVSVSNGAIGKVYQAGNYISDLSGISNVVAPTVAILLAYPQTFVWPAISRAFVIIKRVLTATEHARLYSDLENMTWNTKGLTPGPMMP